MITQELEYRLGALSAALGKKLIERRLRIACAESCSGGLLAKSITDIAGSSAYFDRGVIAYSNEAKRDMLGVETELMIRYGAVSEPVVRQMAMGMMRISQADIAIAISGITGPGGGSPEKPVGTVWFSWLNRGGSTLCAVRQFDGDRQTIRLQTVIFALETLAVDFI